MYDISPAASIQPKLHRGAVPVLPAREALVRGIEMNRLDQLRPHAGTLCDDALDAHQRTQIRRKESSRADVLVPKAVTSVGRTRVGLIQHSQGGLTGSYPAKFGVHDPTLGVGTYYTLLLLYQRGGN